MKSDQSRETSTSPSLKRRAAYTLAASAAAVGTANSADAAIQYSGIQNIAVGSGFFQNLDLNLDSAQDITLQNFNNFAGPYQGLNTFIGAGAVGFTSGFSYISALGAGTLVDGSSNFKFFGSMAYGANNPNAQFNNVTDAYIGVRLASPANTNYGWVRVDVNNANKTLLIKDWAYEDVAGTGIRTGAIPEPGTLGMLAVGAAGLASLRRKRAAA